LYSLVGKQYPGQVLSTLLKRPKAAVTIGDVLPAAVTIRDVLSEISCVTTNVPYSIACSSETFSLRALLCTFLIWILLLKSDKFIVTEKFTLAYAS